MRDVAQPVDVRAALKDAIARLRAARVPSHTLAAELLLMHTLGRDRAWLYAHPAQALDPRVIEGYFELIARRAAGTPTQYLTGCQEFWGLEFEVTPDVLIPRPETEHVVEVALERLGPPCREDGRARVVAGAGLRIADVGTGSGCLAVALAHELPGAEVFATDISAAALGVAQRNAARHGVADRIHFVRCNLLDAFLSASTGPFSLMVSNPPYVGRTERESLPREVREHEPAEALFAGEHGAEAYAPLLEQAARLLAPGGTVVLELGYNALARVRALVADAGCWAHLTITNDLAGIPRVLAAERR
jgi:release factor glutamine methyltransferase